jgi:hypothetical protein
MLDRRLHHEPATRSSAEGPTKIGRVRSDLWRVSQLGGTYGTDAGKTDNGAIDPATALLIVDDFATMSRAGGHAVSTHRGKSHPLTVVQGLVEAHDCRANRDHRLAHRGEPVAHRVHTSNRRERSFCRTRVD